MLIISNFSFPHCVFYPVGGLSDMFIKFKIVVCKLFQFGRVYNVSFRRGLFRWKSYLSQKDKIFSKLKAFADEISMVSMVFYAAFNILCHITATAHYSFLSWISSVLGLGFEMSWPRTLPGKTQRILCGSNPGSLDFKSNT